MKFGIVLVLALAGVANAQQTAGNQGPPAKANQSQAPQALHSSPPGDSYRSRDYGHRGRGWGRERERSGWDVEFHFDYREGSRWGSPPCEPQPPVCPPPICHDTRTERILVPGYWIEELVLDHCGRPVYDWRGCPVTRPVFVPGYTEVVTYRRETVRYWDGCCWRCDERWVECGRERIMC